MADGYNVLFVCVDTLRRDVFGTYADTPRFADYGVETPNVDAFDDRALTFDTHYAGSLPTIPARREYLTGTQEFLWRGWGGLEPFDTTVPALARRENVPSMLVTDNYHQFENRGVHGYYEDFTGFELVRGHEGDAWRTAPREPAPGLCRQVGADDPDDVTSRRAQYARNVAAFEDESDFFAPRVFSTAVDALADVSEWDQWFLMVDSFDVHEPFHCPAEYATRYTDEDLDDPDLPLWHQYGWVDDDYWTERRLAFTRALYAGKVTMIDRWLGRLFDELDSRGLWEETVVVLTSDHGHCLGDHGYVGKNRPACYDEIAKLPLWIAHPDADGGRVEALTSATDLHATLLDALGTEVSNAGPGHSRSLLPLVRGDRETHRDWALYGYYGRSVNVTDGRHTYLRSTDPDGPLYTYSALPPSGGYFGPSSPEDLEVDAFLPYADYPVWRITDEPSVQNAATELYDVAADPGQERDLAGEDEDAAARMRDLLVEGLDALAAPDEQYDRLGLAER